MILETPNTLIVAIYRDVSYFWSKSQFSLFYYKLHKVNQPLITTFPVPREILLSRKFTTLKEVHAKEKTGYGLLFSSLEHCFVSPWARTSSPHRYWPYPSDIKFDINKYR